jgi:hypothetical protein
MNRVAIRSIVWRGATEGVSSGLPTLRKTYVAKVTRRNAEVPV